MMNRKAAGIFSIIMAVQLCLIPYAGTDVQAAQSEEQLFDDSSEGVACRGSSCPGRRQ